MQIRAAVLLLTEWLQKVFMWNFTSVFFFAHAGEGGRRNFTSYYLSLHFPVLLTLLDSVNILGDNAVESSDLSNRSDKASADQDM